MKMKILTAAIAAVLALFVTAAVFAQAPDPTATLAAQKEAMKPFASNHGIWRGQAFTTLANGSKMEITQTERIGPFLNGTIMVIEGRGYDAKTGNVAFNAFGTISFNPRTKAYTLHTYAMGQAGDFPVTATPDGYVWEIPQANIRYTAVIKDGTWHEVGDRIVQGKDPVRFFEMTLKRVGNTDWPAAGAVPIK